MPRPFGWTYQDPRYGIQKFGFGQLDTTLLPAPNTGMSYLDAAGNIIIPNQSGGWSALTASGNVLPGSGPAPLATGTVYAGQGTNYSPLAQSSSGAFGVNLAPLSSTDIFMQNYSGLIGMVGLGLLALLVLKKA